MPSQKSPNPTAVIQISTVYDGITLLNEILKYPNLILQANQILPNGQFIILLQGKESDLLTAIPQAIEAGKITPGKAAWSLITDPHPDLPGHIARLALPENPNLSNLVFPGNTPASAKIEKPLPGIKPIQCELIRINQELFNGGYITSVGGNISVRDPDQPDSLWITPGSIYKGSLKEEDLVRINLDGDEIPPCAYHASSEKYMHSQLLKHRPELNAVIHSHGMFTTILVLTDLPFLPLSAESCFIGEIKRIPYIKSGSRELGYAVAEAIQDSYAVLMQNHGVVVAGRTLRGAADMTQIIEENAEKIIMCYLLGTPPPRLSPRLVEEYRKIGEIRA